MERGLRARTNPIDDCVLPDEFDLETLKDKCTPDTLDILSRIYRYAPKDIKPDVIKGLLEISLNDELIDKLNSLPC